MPAQRDKVHELVQDALKHGAKVLYGGELPSGGGIFYPPTVITGLTPACRLWSEEAFGPLMLLFPARDETEAIKLANGTAFGLGASVMCEDGRTAERLGKQMDSGMCVLNDYGLSYMIQDLPFGGCKVFFLNNHLLLTFTGIGLWSF